MPELADRRHRRDAGSFRKPALLWLLTIGTFAVGADGFVLNGVLPAIGGDLSVSVAVAGQLATAFALTYALAAPALAVFAGAVDRRLLLVGGASVFATGTALQALAPSMAVMVLGRVVAGAGAALYVSNATTTAGMLVSEDRRGRALATVYGGFTVATVAGGPLGLVLADAAGWRPVLAAIAALGLVAGAGAGRLPPIVLPPVSIGRRLAVLVNPAVLVTLLVTLLAQTATMGTQTYLPTLISRLAATRLPLLLAACGAGIMIGTWASGRLIDRLGTQTTRRISLLGLAGVLAAAIPAALLHPGWLFVALPVFGVVAGLVLVPQQQRLVTLAGDTPAVALSWGSSSIYLGGALGSALGGAILAYAGPSLVTPAAAVAAALAALLTLHHRQEG